MKDDDEEDRFFEIRILHGVIKLVNHSKLKLIMSQIPTPPKRKHRDIRIVMPKSFVIFELDTFDCEFDITQVSFRFEDV